MTRKMKDSGFEWIGEIPQGWNIRRLKFLCSIKTGNKDTVNAKDDGQYPFYVRSPKIERIDSYSFDGEAVLTAGDGVGAGKVFHYVNGKFDYHQRVYNLHDFKDIKGKYLYYYLKENFINEIEKSNAKSTVDSVRLPMLLNFPIALPNDEEQIRIESYLDTKCTKIDKTIEKEKQVIEKLKEYKQSVITESVTKGLNHSVKMKDSGVEWIGEIPQHWDTCKVKNICMKITDGAHISPDTENGEYYFISVVNLKNGKLDFNNCLKTSESSYNYMVNTGCQPKMNDVLISKDGTVGKSLVIDFEKDFVVASSFVIITPSEKVNSYFLNYLFKSTVVQEQLNSYMKGTGLKRVSVSNNGKLIITLTTLEEQFEIVEYLDKKCSAIDKLILDKEKLIEKLTEYKKSLIYECVTGKREVQ